MPFWAFASVSYFIYVTVVALLLRRLTRRARLRTSVAAAAGVLLAICAGYTEVFWLRGLVLPLLVLLAAYWSSGFLWIAPMPGAERLLMRSDQSLGIRSIAARTPQAVAELLEAAYCGIYPLIPIALGLYLALVVDADVDRFWTVVLVTDLICFGMLPWIQTRPPRLLEPHAPWRSRLRACNVRLLGQTSIGANTLPSGHAAEALACALLMAGAPAAVQIAMGTAALAVSAGAVFGRYHFALDAITGWIVAIVVWSALAG
jgi:hypothetical protein